MSKHIEANAAHQLVQSNHDDGVDRRGFLKCMAWAGTGVLWTLSGGVPSSYAFSQLAKSATGSVEGDLFFVQISDSHLGFDEAANPHTTETFQAAIDKINALPVQPEFLIHTGDVSHISEPEQFDTADQILKSANTKQVYFVPGEHDVIGDNGKHFRERFAKRTTGDGWYSFDHKGVHFIGLINVLNFKAGGLGGLGTEQLEWLEKDVKGLSESTPIVVFAHIPLWTIYPQWGWGTADSARALSYLKRFGSLTVLNGHIHQVLQKVEGNATFHTAMSTAYPQPAPGVGPAPGPLTVPADRLRRVLGIRGVTYAENNHSVAVIDSSLAASSDRLIARPAKA